MKAGLILALLALIFQLTVVNAQEGNVFPKGIEYVIMIGLDGISPDGMRSATPPTYTAWPAKDR